MYRFRFGWGLAVILLVGAGCANTMSGTLDGQKVGPARSAIFDEAEMSMSIPGFGELVSMQVLQVFISGFPDACALYDRVYDVSYGSCEETCEDLYEIAVDLLGHDEYWALSMTLFPEDAVDTAYTEGGPLDDLSLDDIDWWNLDDLTLTGNDTFTAGASLWDVSAWYDLAACEAACEDDPSVMEDDELAETGEVEVGKFVEDSKLKGNYVLDFGGGDVIRGAFDAEYCDLGLDNLLVLE